MLEDPTVLVICDGDNSDVCDQEIQVRLTPLARGSYDERDVEADLEMSGWRIEDGKHLCPNCVEQQPKSQTQGYFDIIRKAGM